MLRIVHRGLSVWFKNYNESHTRKALRTNAPRDMIENAMTAPRPRQLPKLRPHFPDALIPCPKNGVHLRHCTV